MPELPEVESATRRLRDAMVGRVVQRVETLHASTRRALPDDAAARVAGRAVRAVERVGKHQWIRLDDGSALHAHFRMAGDWAMSTADAPPPAHARALLLLDDGVRVALVDPRALATLQWRGADVAPPALGPDALDPAWDADALGRALHGRRLAIKPALLDQRIVAGVGNIYAAEALWRARLDPRVSAAALGPGRRARVVEGVRTVLRDALDAPGRYQDGEALERLAVYGRAGEPCARCGARVRRIVQAGRSTYFCPGCQGR